MDAQHGVRLVVAYDGTDFVGWQRQPAQRSVEEVLEAAVRWLDPHASRIRGASRTDSGVHALGQIAAFDATRLIPPHGWCRGLNGKLPPDVAVTRAEPVDVGYSPRHDALGKTYRYLVHLGAERNPLWHRTAWHLGPRRARPRPGGVGPPLDLDAMDAAAEAFVGTHDFRAFKASGDQREGTVRTITRVELIRGFAGVPELLAIEVRGTAFLQHMVRILVGTLVEVGRERRGPRDIPSLLVPTAVRDDAGETAPAHGLLLVEVELGRAGLGA